MAAANTFFLANPDHTEMRQNLEYYRMMAGVQEADFKDLEGRTHMVSVTSSYLLFTPCDVILLFSDAHTLSPQAEFLLGKSSYSDDSFGLAAGHFEVAVDEYFKADKECRALCEGAYNYDGYNYMEYSADLFQTVTGDTPGSCLCTDDSREAGTCDDCVCVCVSDHYMQVLSCKQHCAVELASTAGRDKPFEDFLPSHFNYLQFSYYNSECPLQRPSCA